MRGEGCLPAPSTLPPPPVPLAICWCTTGNSFISYKRKWRFSVERRRFCDDKTPFRRDEKRQLQGSRTAVIGTNWRSSRVKGVRGNGLPRSGKLFSAAGETVCRVRGNPMQHCFYLHLQRQCLSLLLFGGKDSIFPRKKQVFKQKNDLLPTKNRTNRVYN